MFRQILKPRDVEFLFAALPVDPPHRVTKPRKIVQDARAQMFHFKQVGARDAAPDEFDRARRQRPARAAENLVVRIGAGRPGRRDTFGAEPGDEVTRRLDAGRRGLAVRRQAFLCIGRKKGAAEISAKYRNHDVNSKFAQQGGAAFAPHIPRSVESGCASA